MSSDKAKKEDVPVGKSSIAEREERILKYWQEKGIFEKTLSKKSPNGEFTFYDGPPFATGLPHYGHILVSVIKDAIPRYKTMRGYHVSRKWGWDCHGLPIENIVEKDLKISGRRQIADYGVAKFNEYARSKVLTYVNEWKKTVDRIGRWVDFDGSYKTMDNSYIESVWWAMKKLHEKGLIYEGTRVLPYCPRCETPIANSEIAMDNSYKDISDISVYAKFRIKGEKEKYFLAWTTTPWTLPGNFALAVNPDAVYAVVEIKNKDGGKESLILAKERLSVLKDEHRVVAEVKGVELVGQEYEPLFGYFTGRDFSNKDRAWKVYSAGFVTMTDGTGIVHIAPGYGEEDMELAKKENIPFIHHVTAEGKFAEIVSDFAGRPVKPKDNPQEADVEIIRFLAKSGGLLDKEKIVHPYPHCYRCETPLYYYAMPAWFVKIQGIKPSLLELNQKINWIPEHLKNGRFKNGLEGAPDWNISRNRFWASPLPFWRCGKCAEIKVPGGLDDIRGKQKNKYVFVRHGEAENNVSRVVSVKEDSPHHLTEKGREEIKKAGTALKKTKWDFIFYSPLLRTRESAEILAEVLGVPKENVFADKRLREIGAEKFEGMNIDEYRKIVGEDGEEGRFEDGKGAESFYDIKKRVGDFIYEMEAKYAGKNILVVAHDIVVWLAVSAASLLDKKATLSLRAGKDVAVRNAEYKEINLAVLPHDERYELNLHRPYVDDFHLDCRCGEKMKRVEEVVDCWFESGSMPFASNHYPFENVAWLKKNFPADFVAEYVPQTRTWFYYMHVLSTVLFGKAPFKNVLTHGTILAEDGQKMSKSKGNFPDPWIVFDKYGVDALRFYLLSSPAIKAEDINFVVRDLDAVSKKIINRLDNVLSFYNLYKTASVRPRSGEKNVLDKWISSRMSELLAEATEGCEKYELDRVLRAVDSFIDDLSVWYIRRSRERFKSEDNDTDRKDALDTTAFVLFNLSKIMAPFTPFFAEHLYKELAFGTKDSVHLEDWPKLSAFKRSDRKLSEEMSRTRKYCSEILELRARSGIKVRQPLSSAEIRGSALSREFVAIIKDETNLKKVTFILSFGKTEAGISLDTQITPELKKEGMLRELTRAIQDERKISGLTVRDRATVFMETDDESRKIFESAEAEILNAVKADSLVFSANLKAENRDLGGFSVKITVAKVG